MAYAETTPARLTLMICHFDVSKKYAALISAAAASDAGMAV
ncbi:MAG: hypothetical protein WAQ05_06690 [Rubrivivax sp.]